MAGNGKLPTADKKELNRSLSLYFYVVFVVILGCGSSPEYVSTGWVMQDTAPTIPGNRSTVSVISDVTSEANVYRYTIRDVSDSGSISDTPLCTSSSPIKFAVRALPQENLWFIEGKCTLLQGSSPSIVISLDGTDVELNPFGLQSSGQTAYVALLVSNAKVVAFHTLNEFGWYGFGKGGGILALPPEDLPRVSQRVSVQVPAGVSNADLVVARIVLPGQVDWVHSLEASGWVFLKSTHEVADGSIIVGRFTESLAVDGNIVASGLPPSEDTLFVLKVDARGNVQWVRVLGPVRFSSDGYFASAATDRGTTIVVSAFSGTLALPTHPKETKLRAVPGGRVMACEIDPQGAVLWGQILGKGWLSPVCLLPTKKDNFVLYASFASDMAFSSGGHDVRLTDGGYVWAELAINHK